jgi:signal transduction histidine kinase
MEHADDGAAREALGARAFSECLGALVLVDHAGVVVDASSGMARLLGQDRAALPGQDFGNWFVPLGSAQDCLTKEGCQGGVMRQLQIRHADGSLIPVELACNNFRLPAELAPPAAAAATPLPPGHHCIFRIEDVRQRDHTDQLRAARLAKLPLLNQVNEAFYGAHLTLDQILQATLICMTAGEGLRFNRSFLLLVHENEGTLKGEIAIGPSNADEAARIWQDLAGQPGDLFEMMTSYDQSIKMTDAAVNEIVRHMVVPLDDAQNVLVRSMHERRVVRITPDLPLPGAETLRGWLGCAQFAIAPLVTRSGPLGVIVADNAISGNEITELDLEFLQMFANQSAHAIENSRLYHELERRLMDLRKAHEKQKEDQQTLLRMERLSVMGETSAIVAHELRNPLVAIGGFARSLTRNLPEDDPNRQFAVIISDEVARMEEIIHDLLDFIRPRKMMRLSVKVDRLIADAAEKFRLEMEEKGQRLVLNLGCGDLALECHPGEIEQVLQNYLMNAIQVQPSGGEVEVRTTLVEGGAKVEVLDRGPGFAQDEDTKLFAPFYSTKPTGSGLGLTICAQIIKAHGGVTGAANREDGGAVFSFILPLPRED